MRYQTRQEVQVQVFLNRGTGGCAAVEGKQTVGSAVLRARRRVNPTATHCELMWTQTQWWGAPAARERRRKGPRTGTAAGAMIDAITADGNSIVVFGLPHRKGGSGGGRGGVSSAVHELDIL